MITSIQANRLLGVTDWGGARPRDNNRWQYTAPPVGNRLTQNKTSVGSFSA